jgi:hypothetical protein
LPAKAGIHDLPLLQQRKSWMPAFAGKTMWAAPMGRSFRPLVLVIMHDWCLFRLAADEILAALWIALETGGG